MNATRLLMLAGFTVAICSWAVIAYCLVRAWLARPPGAWYIPPFGDDREMISPIGVVWRRRAYISIIPFIVLWLVSVVATATGHRLKPW